MRQAKVNSRKFIAVFTAVCMLLTFMPMSVAAAETEVTETAVNSPAFQDVTGHWGQTAIEKWSGYGIINGYNGMFRPDDSITRGEMAVILDNLMDYQVAAENKFSDLKAGQFYTEAILKANAAGIIKGDGATVRPLDKITREESAVMMSRAFAVAESGSAMSFGDASAVSAWAKGAVAGMEAKGYVSGYAGKFDPKSNITRAAAVTMINNIVKAYYTKAGTYTDNVDGTAIIKVSDVILKGVTISGNLIIAEGVGKGDATLDNVTVKGETVVRGGGENSVHIIGSSSIASIRIEKIGDKLRIVVADGATVREVEVAVGEEIVITGTVGTLEVNASNAVVYAIAAEITTATVNGDNPTIVVGAQSTINSVIISSSADNTAIKAETGSVVKSVEASATVAVTGTGTVSTVTLKTGADGSSVTTPKTVVPVSTGVTGVTGTGGTVIPAGSSGTNGTSVTAPATVGGSTPPASSGGGGGGSSTVAVSAISVSPGTLTLTAGGATGTLTATVSPAGATNKNVTWATSNNAVATVVNGVVTPKTAGTATITATTVDGGFSKTVDVTVNPAPVTLVSIAITTPATKLAYNVGETLDIAGLVVTGTYSNSSTKAETITTANVSGFNSSTVAASQTLTVTVNGKMTSYVISIVKKAGPILTGVTADNVTNKVTGMAATMEFSTDGITWVKYNETTPNLPDLTGDVDLQVRFASTATHEAGAATTFNFTAATLESIAVKTSATKLVYKAGEALDITGLVIEGTYSDASKKDVAITAANVSGFDSTTVVASQTLTVTVDGKTTTYTVEIKAATLESIAIKTPATKLVYKVGETLDITGLVIEGTYSNGSKKNETITAANVTGFDSSAVVESQTLTVTVDGKTTTYTVEIKAATLVSIAVKTPATKLVYTLGETLDITGLVIEGTYSDASKKDETITSSNVTGFNSSAVVVSQTLTVTVDGKTTTYTVEIKPAATLSSIAVKMPATKLVYAVGETLDITGLVIEGTYSDSSKRIITITSSNVSGFNSSAVVASQALTVTVDGKTTTYTVEIQAVSVTGVSLNQTTMSLKVGTGTGTLTATIAPANATNKTVTWESSNTSVATVDSNGKVTPVATGTTTITVTTADGSKTATCTVTVTEANIATQVFVGGNGEDNTLNNDYPYWVNGARSKTPTVDSYNWTAHFKDGILTLHNYNGGAISSGIDIGKDFIVKLEGINTVNGASTGISNGGGGDIYITADNDATLTVNTVSADNFSYAIAAGYITGYPSGSVIIGGKAKVTIDAETTGTSNTAIGISAKNDVTIHENADLTIITKTAGSYDNKGIFAGNNITINTTKNIAIDLSTNTKGLVLYGWTIINNVNLMTLKAPTDGGFIFGSTDLSGVAVNIAGKVASYRSGTPYTIEVKNGEITGVAAGVFEAGQQYQALANDEITIKSKTIPLFEFVKWMDAEGNDLDASLFTDGTTASSPEATIKMLANNLNIKAQYKSTLFTTQPVFHRGDEKITWKISQAADFGYLQKKTGETWGDTSISLPRTLEGTATVRDNPGNHYENAPDGTYRLAFYFNPNDNEFLKHYSEQFEILWDAQLVGTVTISGTPKSGETLTANVTDTQSDAGDLKYQWFADEAKILGATEKTLVLGEDQVGKQIKVKVSSHNYNMPIESAATVAVAKADPIVASISNVVAINGTVTITLDKKPSVAPIADDFTATSKIDSGVANTLELTGFNYDDNVTVTYNFTPVVKTTAIQSVVVAVTYNSVVTVAPTFEVEANVGATETPVISGTVKAGDTSVSGTAVDGATVVLSVNASAKPGVIATGGNWTVSGLTLAENDVIKVTAILAPNTISLEATTTVLAALDKEITGFTALTSIALDADEKIIDLAALKASGKLPTEVTVTDGTTSAQATITDWTGTFDGSLTGAKTLTAVWTMPAGYVDVLSPITVEIVVNVNVVQTPREVTGYSYIGNNYVYLTSNEKLVTLAELIASGKLPTEVTVTDGITPAQATITNWTGTYNGGLVQMHEITAVWTMPANYVDEINPITVKFYVHVNVRQIPFEGGTGSDSDPYQIKTAEQLNYIRYFHESNFIQTADIDLSAYLSESGAGWNDGAGWEPIGKWDNSTTGFAGSYNGNNKTITGLYINRPTSDYQGLFGRTRLSTNKTKLEKIRLIDVNISGKDYIGGLSGDLAGNTTGNEKTIEKCYVSGSVSGSSNVGGLVGSNYSIINNSNSNASVSGNSNVGGLVGINHKTIGNCYAVGLVTGTGTYVGGLVGENRGVPATVTLSYYDSTTTGQSDTGKGVGETTANMKTQSTFTGWDFTNIWTIETGSYPTLR